MATKAARRGHGTGGLYQRAADQMWCASIELPDRDGKRRRKVIARTRYADAVIALREARRELDRTGDLATSSPTMATWLALWLSIVRAEIKPRTLETYQGNVQRYLVPAFGKVRLDKLSQHHVRRMHDQMTEHGLSSTTILQAHRILAKALADAMREGRISHNVAKMVRPPRKQHTKRLMMTADEARAFLWALRDDPDAAARWSVALLTGMRQGEQLGITSDAVNLNAGTITVVWQVQRLKFTHGCSATAPWLCGKVRAGSCPKRYVYIPPDQEATQVHGGLWMTRPKSRAGWREVPIAPLLAEILTRHMELQPPGDAGLIFTTDEGHPIDPRDDSAAWDAALAKTGAPDVVLHSARHTTATLLYELGVPEPTRVQIMGHSSATTTAGYTHVSDPLARDAMGRLGARLTPQIEG